MHNLSSHAEGEAMNGHETGEAEFGHELHGEHDIPNPNSHEFEFEGELGEFESAFNENEEAELAAEFLEISSEAEMEQFLGKLLKRAARGIGKFARSGIGRAIGGALRTVAKVGLPLAAGAAGTFFGGPLGGMIGKKLGSMVSDRLELGEMGEMSEGEQEFEMARRFVRIAGASTRAAMKHSTNLRGYRDAVRLVNRATRMHGPVWASWVQDGLRSRRRQARIPRRNRYGAVTMGAGPGTFRDRDDDGGYDNGNGVAPGGVARWYRRGRKIVFVME